jgi:hypothetical protein
MQNKNKERKTGKSVDQKQKFPHIIHKEKNVCRNKLWDSTVEYV